jgi:hypothetical protein
MASTDSHGAASVEERGVMVTEDEDVGAADTDIIGETGGDVIGGGQVTGPGESGGRDPEEDPDLGAISGGMFPRRRPPRQAPAAPAPGRTWAPAAKWASPVPAPPRRATRPGQRHDHSGSRMSPCKS